MSTTIYVFSATGTSLAVAEGISKEIENVEIISIPNLLNNFKESEIKIKSEKVGVIFPCYFGTMPKIVMDFIRKANVKDVNYIFGISTCGGSKGITLKALAGELKRKGKNLDYGRSLSLSGNYIVGWYYRLSYKQGNKLKNALSKLEESIVSISNDIVCEKSYIEKGSYLQYRFSRFLSSKKIADDTRVWDKDFSVNENCNGCSICSKVCQVNNIKMNNNKPNFQHNCQRCMACIQYCSKNAIRYKNKDINKPKYYHPEFSATKMIDFINGQ